MSETHVTNIDNGLLPPLKREDHGKKLLVIDLDETLVHSSFKPIEKADFIVPVEVDGIVHQVYVQKRPYVDEFLQRMGQLYECVLFTASLAKYADPVADLLDRWNVFRARLFRDACVFHKGNYVKDLARLGRDIKHTLILDNSPGSYVFHPENAVPVVSWFDDIHDRELLDMIPFFEAISTTHDVQTTLRNFTLPTATASNKCLENLNKATSIIQAVNRQDATNREETIEMSKQVTTTADVNFSVPQLSEKDQQPSQAYDAEIPYIDYTITAVGTGNDVLSILENEVEHEKSDVLYLHHLEKK